ncbi:hypothetical protein, unknown function [Leishmania tarentolae]|uniref:Uncharacterized protein n=1 Tax=Leishmania tarentolae TaxID=5689 RepID=A0A640KNV9_LEITA|nr:hypothetical protein, unknown function [Leishmania tarentolae]
MPGVLLLCGVPAKPPAQYVVQQARGAPSCRLADDMTERLRCPLDL